MVYSLLIGVYYNISFYKLIEHINIFHNVIDANKVSHNIFSYN